MARSKEAPPAKNWPVVLVALLTRRIGIAVVALAVLVGLCVAGWRHFGPTISRSPQYVLDESKFDVTPQPTWIHANVKRDALRSGGLVGASILDPKLNEKVEKAFAVQTWVASVERIAKFTPARVVVEIEYRRPAAMVEVSQAQERGLLPVDAYGVLLPPEDFSANQVRKFLRVAIGPTQPEGPVGTKWGDPKIVAAAKIAVSIEEIWPKLQLYRIVHTGDDAGGKPSFDIATRDGAKVIWGHAPGDESSGEATATEKLVQLKAWHDQHGPLTASSQPREINVRDGQRRTTPTLPVKLQKS